jgi:hypothetical protein
MAYILVQQSVADYAKWKFFFDEDGPIRQAGGSKGGMVLRNADDPHHVTVLLEWDSLESACVKPGLPGLSSRDCRTQSEDGAEHVLGFRC